MTDQVNESKDLKPKNKTGCVLIVVGRQGAGKTPETKKMALESGMKNKIVYDPRKEYDEGEYTIFYTSEKFKNYIQTVSGSFIIAEEATGFIASFKDLELTDFLISIEHKRNVFVLLFHSLLDVPQYISRLARGVILLETNDDPQAVKSSRGKYYKYLGLARPMQPVYIDNYKE